MTGNKRTFLTGGSVSPGGWRLVEPQQNRTIASDTRGTSNENVLLVQGRMITHASGISQVVVTVDPAAIDRKLTIRKLNDRLEGRAPRSDTFADFKPRR
jgi:hypothetical protein